MATDCPLFTWNPKLKKIPKLSLAETPTPVRELTQLQDRFPWCPVYVKEDNLSNPKYGGNKVRKYEFVLAKAIKKGKTHILTTGGIGSNHALANTIFCQQLGLESYIYLFDQPLNEGVRKNLLLDYSFGAEMFYTKGYGRTGIAMLWQTLTDREAFLVMPGASTPLGTVGFVNAAMELQQQIDAGESPPIDELYVAVGSTGTCAGLALGLALLDSPIHVTGVLVSHGSFADKAKVISQMEKTLKYLQKFDPEIPDISATFAERVEVIEDFFGGEYGRVTHEGQIALELAKKAELDLENTYTAKAFACLLADLMEQQKSEGKKFLFWNTYNSVDLSERAAKIDYQELPPDFHQFFDGTVPLDTTAVWANPEHEEKFKALKQE